MSGEPNGVGNGNANNSTSGQGPINGLNEVDDESDNHESDPLSQSFQSNATTDVDGLDGEQGKATSTYLKSPYWWLGQILITLGEMGNFLAYGFAPASIVSPLGVVALVSNCIIAPAMFHERFRARDFWGVVIAVAGVVTVVFSANQEETKLEPHDVWDAITTMEFEIYLGVTILLIIILMWASSRYGRRTILIDLGLVGLFGWSQLLSSLQLLMFVLITTYRWLHCACNQGRFVYVVSNAMESIHDSSDLCPRFHSSRHGHHANSIRQQSFAAFRLDTSDTNSVCLVYTLCNSRKCHSLPRL